MNNAIDTLREVVKEMQEVGGLTESGHDFSANNNTVNNWADRLSAALSSIAGADDLLYVDKLQLRLDRDASGNVTLRNEYGTPLITSPAPQEGFVMVPAPLPELVRRFVEPREAEGGYGFYRPENPHDFSPDRECCTEEEITAHKAACEAFDAGKYEHDDWDGWNDDHTIHVLRAPWGVGSYTYRDPNATQILSMLPPPALKPSAQGEG